MSQSFIEKHWATLMSEIFAGKKFRGFFAKVRNLVNTKYTEGGQPPKLFPQKSNF